MLLVISYPTALADEAANINYLFDEGLKILHIRKPGVAVDEIKVLIEKIKPQYHHQIALHQHHEIAGDFGINRLHFTEAKRKEMIEEALIKLKSAKYILSTSIHKVEEYKSLSSCFDYTFFGPVFNSISKQGYNSSITEDFIFPVRENRPKVIAIGGINITTVQKINDMKFSGVAVLGAIWETPDESIQQFKALQKTWK